MSDRFLDTNVLFYLLAQGPKQAVAERELAAGGTISVQVLNELASICRRKAAMDWQETGEFLFGLRALLTVRDLTLPMHDAGRAVAERYGLALYDGMIAGAALVCGCTTLVSEDMQDGLLIEGRLRIRNPFRGE